MGYTFQAVCNMRVLCMSIIDAVSEYKSSHCAHCDYANRMQAQCVPSMCGSCKVFSIVYSPTPAPAGYQFWSPYDQAPHVYIVFPVMLS